MNDKYSPEARAILDTIKKLGEEITSIAHTQGLMRGGSIKYEYEEFRKLEVRKNGFQRKLNVEDRKYRLLRVEELKEQYLGVK